MVNCNFFFKNMKQFFINNVKSSFLKFLLFTFLLFIFSLSGYAQNELPPKPKVQTSVYDGANILSNAQINSLKHKLINYADSTSTQIVVITIPSTNGDDINLFTAELGQKWGIGQKGKDNGVILMIAFKDRKIAIQNGYGVESNLTDFLSKRIIDQIITPEFKQGAYYKGIDSGTTAMMQVLSGQFKETRQFKTKRKSKKFPFGTIIIFIIIFLILSRRNKGGGKGGRLRGPSLLDALILTSLGSSGGGGFGGSSGGGFGGGGFSGGFGGGGFGGGGASGGW